MDEKRTFKELILYKIDRTLAVVGIVAVTALALWQANEQVALVGIGALGGYLGAKATTSKVDNGK